MLRNKEKNRYRWQRLWISPADLEGVAVRGLFSANMHSLTLATGNPEARTLEGMQDIRALLLRGEAGAGKSFAIDREIERLQTAGEQVELADMADGLCDLPLLLREKGDQPDLTIFVDALDIGLIRDKGLEVELRRTVSRLPHQPGARLRFVLRSGFAADSFTTSLESHFGDDFEHLTIAPLRSEDVRIAASAEGIDPNQFFAALEGIQVAPLAARPLTLRFMLRLWARNNCLPTRRQDLYRDGCADLLRETNPIRLEIAGGHDPDYAGHLELSERFSVAARLAALMTFGDYDHIDFSAEPNEAGLHFDAVTGRGGSIAAPPKLTGRAIREVVGSALFRPVGQNRFAFSHPSFMRFLAADFVAVHDIPLSEGVTLLSAPDGRIGANRVEVASWLGVLRPAYFDHLANSDPQVLLRAGIPASSGDLRLHLAKSILAHSADGGLDHSELSATGDLVLLASPGLEELLAAVVADKDELPARRELAARIAADSGCVPVDAFSAVALNADEPLNLRSTALVALAQNVSAAASCILKLSSVENLDEELRVAALALAMPTLLSPAEVIRCLKPGARDDAQTRLVLHVKRNITQQNLPEALKAIAAVAKRSKNWRDYHAHLLLAQSLSRLAFEHLDDPQVRHAFAEFIATIPAREPWLRWSFPLQKYGLHPSVTLEQRRALVSAVVANASRSVTAARNLLEGCFLIQNEDFSWIAIEARSALDSPQGAVWATLAVEVAIGFGGIPYAHLRQEGLSDAEIHRLAAVNFKLPQDYERWTLPRSWDTFQEQSPQESETDYDSEDQKHTESIIRALEDWKLQTIQAVGGGRLNATSVLPTTLLELASNSEQRLVRDSYDLLRVVQESLGRLQQRLKGRDALVKALWNEGKSNSPKGEEFLSDFIADHLRHDLVLRRVVADREVKIRSRISDTAGERTDIQVQAFTRPKGATRHQRIASLTIEVKGCWNEHLYTAMENQLVDRYLKTTDENVGLYLIGWYVCPAWNNPEIAKTVPTKLDTISAVHATLDAQALRLSRKDRRIGVMLIDATLS